MESSRLRNHTSTGILSLVSAVLIALLPGSAWGQATTSVRGTVADPTGSLVAGAAVVLANSEARIERTAKTGGQGEYQFLFVPPVPTR